MTNVLPPKKDDNVSVLEPPFHYHIHQKEWFHVLAGRGNFYCGLDPEPFAVLSATPGESATASIEPGRYHRFENASKTENLELTIHLAPESYEAEVRFFRNFFGYLDDCKKAKMSPSLFQLLVFLHDADTPLALALPTEWLGRLVSRVFLIAAATWGRWVLGYRVTYPEYYEDGKTR